MNLMNRGTRHAIYYVLMSYVFSYLLVITIVKIVVPNYVSPPAEPVAVAKATCGAYIPPKTEAYPQAPVLSSSTLADDTAFKSAIVAYVKTLQKAYDGREAEYESSYLKYRSTCPH